MLQAEGSLLRVINKKKPLFLQWYDHLTGKKKIYLLWAPKRKLTRLDYHLSFNFLYDNIDLTLFAIQPFNRFSDIRSESMPNQLIILEHSSLNLEVADGSFI